MSYTRNYTGVTQGCTGKYKGILVYHIQGHTRVDAGVDKDTHTMVPVYVIHKELQGLDPSMYNDTEMV